MAYNPNAPADDQFLADFPAEQREQQRALKDDQIVDASKLRGMSPGNANGNIPVSNGNKCANLNADMLDGHDSTYFAAASHVHSVATASSNGFMSNTDKSKLDGIDTGAEVNQNAFANVKVGTVTIQADNKQDTLVLEAGSNIVISLDAANDKVVLGVGGVLPVTNGGTGSSTEKYLPLAGGTMTGRIVMTNATPLAIQTKYTDGSETTTVTDFVRAKTDNTGYGNNIAFGANGNTIIGAGESWTAQLNELEGNSNENCYVCADGTVYIKPNCNTFANAKTFAFTTDGKFQFPDGTKIWIE